MEPCHTFLLQFFPLTLLVRAFQFLVSMYAIQTNQHNSSTHQQNSCSCVIVHAPIYSLSLLHPVEFLFSSCWMIDYLLSPSQSVVSVLIGKLQPVSGKCHERWILLIIKFTRLITQIATTFKSKNRVHFIFVQRERENYTWDLKVILLHTKTLRMSSVWILRCT